MVCRHSGLAILECEVSFEEELLIHGNLFCVCVRVHYQKA